MDYPDPLFRVRAATLTQVTICNHVAECTKGNRFIDENGDFCLHFFRVQVKADLTNLISVTHTGFKISFRFENCRM